MHVYRQGSTVSSWRSYIYSRYYPLWPSGLRGMNALNSSTTAAQRAVGKRVSSNAAQRAVGTRLASIDTARVVARGAAMMLRWTAISVSTTIFINIYLFVTSAVRLLPAHSRADALSDAYSRPLSLRRQCEQCIKISQPLLIMHTCNGITNNSVQ